MIIHIHELYKCLVVNECQSLPGTHAYSYCTMMASAASSVFHFEQLVVFPATGVHATPDVLSAAARACAEQGHVPQLGYGGEDGTPHARGENAPRKAGKAVGEVSTMTQLRRVIFTAEGLGRRPRGPSWTRLGKA